MRVAGTERVASSVPERERILAALDESLLMGEWVWIGRSSVHGTGSVAAMAGRSVTRWWIAAGRRHTMAAVGVVIVRRHAGNRVVGRLAPRVTTMAT